MFADMKAFVYEGAYVLTAGIDYDVESVSIDSRKHITNLSVNKRIAGHPGQIPVNLAVDYAAEFAQICDIWRCVVEAAAPFMRIQKSARRFEFFGIDVVVNASGQCWLIEINRYEDNDQYL